VELFIYLVCLLGKYVDRYLQAILLQRDNCRTLHIRNVAMVVIPQ
jgi:hypothetical protein